MLSSIDKIISSVLVILLLVMIGFTIYYDIKANKLEKQLIEAKKTIKDLESRLALQNAQILQNKQDYEKKLKEFTEAIKTKDATITKLKKVKVNTTVNICKDLTDALEEIKTIYTQQE